MYACFTKSKSNEAKENSNFNFLSNNINTNINSTASIMLPLLAGCTVADVKRAWTQLTQYELSKHDHYNKPQCSQAQRSLNINPMNFYSLVKNGEWNSDVMVNDSQKMVIIGYLNRNINLQLTIFALFRLDL